MKALALHGPHSNVLRDALAGAGLSMVEVTSVISTDGKSFGIDHR